MATVIGFIHISQLGKHGVINDEFANLPLVIMYRRDTLSVLDEAKIRASRLIPAATAFVRRIEGRVLEFQVYDNDFRDIQTGTTWNLLGQAITGPLKGRTLEPLEAGVHFTFAWLAFRPDSEIYQPSRSGKRSGNN